MGGGCSGGGGKRVDIERKREGARRVSEGEREQKRTETILREKRQQDST